MEYVYIYSCGSQGVDKVSMEPFPSNLEEKKTNIPYKNLTTRSVHKTPT